MDPLIALYTEHQISLKLSTQTDNCQFNSNAPPMTTYTSIQARSSCQDAVIQTPFVNLRRAPTPLALIPQHKDYSQESQLLLGEKIRVLEEKQEWVYVEAVEQPRYNKEAQCWEGYKGWIPLSSLAADKSSPSAEPLLTCELWTSCQLDTEKTPLSLSFGTSLEALEQSEEKTWRVRLPDGRKGTLQGSARRLPSSPSLNFQQALLDASLFLEQPYFWGGLTSYHPHLPHSGVDCSGLILLLYRVQGLCIPRDAHDQYLRSQPIELLQSLSPPKNCLMFSTPHEQLERMDHVGLIGSDYGLTESTEQSQSVRHIPLKEKMKIQELPNLSEQGQLFGSMHFFFCNLY